MSRLTEYALNYPKHLLSPQATIVHLQLQNNGLTTSGTCTNFEFQQY